MRVIERIWNGESALDQIARAALSPLEMAYRGIVTARGEFYDRGVLKARKSSIPVVSVGNLSVGGTGKTPVSAWIAQRLTDSGERPAIVMRGYGDDEPRVHARMNPAIPVIVAADRTRGIESAAHGGATIVVLDDGFQHRRAARDADIVLVSADEWNPRARVLPAGPYREPLSALSRATAIIITRKAADDVKVAEVIAAVQGEAAGKPVAVARLWLDQIVRETGPREMHDVSALDRKSVLAIAAVGNPGAFFEQLDCAGAALTRRSFADHHAFSRKEAGELAVLAERHDFTVCTLKDAVKLGAFWPAAAKPLWYVSLAVSMERGLADIDRILARVRS